MVSTRSKLDNEYRRNLTFFYTECSPFYFGDSCNNKCSPNCQHGTCFENNGSCVDGCKCSIVEELQSQGHIINIPYVNDIKVVLN